MRRGSLSLKALATTLDLPIPTHRAMEDVLTLQALFHRLVNEMAHIGVVTLGDALRFARGLLLVNQNQKYPLHSPLRWPTAPRCALSTPQIAARNPSNVAFALSS